MFEEIEDKDFEITFWADISPINQSPTIGKLALALAKAQRGCKIDVDSKMLAVQNEGVEIIQQREIVDNDPNHIRVITRLQFITEDAKVEWLGDYALAARIGDGEDPEPIYRCFERVQLRLLLCCP